MQVKKWMTRNPISISENTLLPEAYRILREYEIRHLPVTTETGRVIGLVSDHDIGQRLLTLLDECREAQTTGQRKVETAVSEIMSTNVQTVRPDDSVVVAALLIHNRKIGCVPVLNGDGELEGILTTNDLLEILVSLLSDDSTPPEKAIGSPGL